MYTTAAPITVRRRWTMLGCSLLAAVTTTTIVSGPAYLIPAWHSDEGMSLTEASTLATVPTIGLMLAIFGWGVMLDRYGERRILILSLCISLAGATGAALAALANAPYPVLAAAMFVGGVGSGAANGASGRIVVGWFPPGQRGTAMGVRQMAQPLGIGLCALTMAATASEVSVGAALMIPAAVTAAGLLGVIVGISDPPRPAAATGPQPAMTASNPYRESTFLIRVHVVSALLVVPQTMLWTFVPTWLIVGHGWSPTTAGLLITITQVTGAFGRIAAGRWSDVWSSRMRPIRVISAVAIVAMIALAVTDWLDSPVAVALMVVASIVTVADNGLAFTAIAEYAGPEWSGRGLAVQNTGQYLVTAAATPAFGALIAAIGFPFAFAVAAIAPVLATPLVPDDHPPRH
ncbi:MFS transporter [Gordonia sp. ABSL1-1]|uniref:MFS transporter n=1 Tax=Gordonia sp. ABSL1-1 TaxID=3053923 RepID=UPI0025733684|nr:MFS transporter [Gordonia sp. ABSL1-1]MDL9935580.1 MFS transporter [Gordonia sp. ABSL1-1]